MPYTGLLQAVDWDVAGGTPTWKAFDRITGGSMGHPSDRQHRQGIKGADSIAYGAMLPTLNVTGILQTFAWSAHLKRASIGALPAELQVQGGLVTAGIEFYQHTGSRIDSCRLSCGGIGEPVEYDVTLLSFTSADDASPSAATSVSGATMEWHEGDVTIGASNYICTAWEAELNNNLVVEPSLDAGTADQLRWPEYADPGDHIATCSLTIRTPLGIDLRVDEPETTDYDIVLVMQNAAASTTKTLTMTNLFAEDSPQELARGAEGVSWRVDLEGKFNDLPTWAIA